MPENNHTKCVEGAVAAYPLYQVEGGGAIPTSTLQFVIRETDMRTACDLNRRWHSILPRTDLGNMLCGNMSIAYVAEYSDYLYAVAIWSQPIIAAIMDGSTIELRRLAICKDAPKNTASRMLAVMKKDILRRMPTIARMVSYLAVDVHCGSIYKAAGWLPVGQVVNARPQRLTGSNQRATGPLQTTSRKQRWETYRAN